MVWNLLSFFDILGIPVLKEDYSCSRDYIEKFRFRRLLSYQPRNHIIPYLPSCSNPSHWLGVCTCCAAFHSNVGFIQCHSHHSQVWGLWNDEFLGILYPYDWDSKTNSPKRLFNGMVMDSLLLWWESRVESRFPSQKGEVPGNDAPRKKQIRRGWAPVFDSVQWRYLCGWINYGL